jgi:hypothetical protein
MFTDVSEVLAASIIRAIALDWTGLRLAQPGGPTDRLSVLSSLLPEDGSGIQLSKRCNFIIL